MLRAQVAGLLVRNGRLLLCLRSSTRSYYPGAWDLPGGHVEPGESDDIALRRELLEELGIAIHNPPRPAFARIVEEAAGFDLKIWIVRSWRGTPENQCPAEHDAIDWFLPSEIADLKLALPQYGDLLRHAAAQAD